jgi:hypothetical protein
MIGKQFPKDCKGIEKLLQKKKNQGQTEKNGQKNGKILCKETGKSLKARKKTVEGSTKVRISMQRRNVVVLNQIARRTLKFMKKKNLVLYLEGFDRIINTRYDCKNARALVDTKSISSARGDFISYTRVIN